MPEPETRKPITVWLAIDDDGVAVRVYSRDDRLTDAYHAAVPSIAGAQAEITARYVDRGYEAEGEWRAQRWTTDPTGYGEIIHESSRTFH